MILLFIRASYNKNNNNMWLNVFINVHLLVYQIIINYSLTFQSVLVTWCTSSLTFNNCTFYPHCIYVFCIYVVADIAGGNEAEGVWEHGVEENIWN